MRIQEPPASNTGLEDYIAHCVRELNDYFDDANFEERYFPKFDWFRESLQQTERILNVGCGAGRETFALMWAFKAAEARGIDENSNKIKAANMMAVTIRRLVTEIVPRTLQLKSLPEGYPQQLQAWYESKIPSEIKSIILPSFREESISDTMLEPPDHFDLVYCRYVLDKVIDNEGKNGLRSAIRNLKSAVSPEMGRIVVVLPTKRKDGTSLEDLQSHFIEGFNLMLVEPPVGESCLGGTEALGTEPKGYIFKRGICA